MDVPSLPRIEENATEEEVTGAKGCPETWSNQSLDICKADMGSDAFHTCMDKSKKGDKSGSMFGSLDKARMNMAVSKLKSVLGQENSLFHQHNAVAATGYAVFLQDPRLPDTNFFVPGRRHRLRIRFASMGCADDGASCPRAAYIKFADQHDEGPLDLLMSTGRVALARNMKTLQEVAGFSKKEVKHVAKNDPAFHFALVDACRRAPESYSDQRYYAHIAYKLVDRQNNENLVRFRLIPADDATIETGLLGAEEQEMPWESARKHDLHKGRDYLRKEFTTRLLAAPIRFKLQMQIYHGQNDNRLDAWNAQEIWKESLSPWFNVGDLTVTTLVPPAVTRRTTFTIRNRPCCLKLDPPVSTKDFRSLHKALTIIHNTIEEKQPSKVVQAGSDVTKSECWHVTMATEQVVEEESEASVDVYIILTGTERRCTAVRLISNDEEEKSDKETDTSTSDDEEEKKENKAKERKLTTCTTYSILTEPVGDLLTVMVHVRHRHMMTHWFLRYVTVANEDKTMVQKFPCYRVVLNRVVLMPGTATLPGTDENEIMRNERLMELAERRDKYRWAKTEGLPSHLAAKI